MGKTFLQTIFNILPRLIALLHEKVMKSQNNKKAISQSLI